MARVVVGPVRLSVCVADRSCRWPSDCALCRRLKPLRPFVSRVAPWGIKVTIPLPAAAAWWRSAHPADAPRAADFERRKLALGHFGVRSVGVWSQLADGSTQSGRKRGWLQDRRSLGQMGPETKGPCPSRLPRRYAPGRNRFAIGHFPVMAGLVRDCLGLRSLHGRDNGRRTAAWRRLPSGRCGSAGMRATRTDRHRPTHFGARFSMNAVRPSL